MKASFMPILLFMHALVGVYESGDDYEFIIRKQKLASFDEFSLENIPYKIILLQEIPYEHEVRLQGPRKILEALEFRIKDKKLIIKLSSEVIIPQELNQDSIKCYIRAPESLNFSTNNSPQCKFYGIEEKKHWCSVS